MSNPTPGVSRHWRSAAIGLLSGVAAYAVLRDKPAVSSVDGDIKVYAVQPPAADPRLAKVLDAVDVDDVPLGQALRAISRQAGLNYCGLWDPADPGPATRPITVHLQHVSAQAALDAVVRASRDPRADWYEQGGVVTAGPLDLLDRGPVEARAYDIAPLLRRIEAKVPDPPPDGSRAATFSKQQPRQSKRQEALEEAKSAITFNVSRDSWVDNGGETGLISTIGDRLIITQTPAAHRRIQAFLKLLEAAK